MKKGLTEDQLAEIKELSSMSDEDIDHSDIPSVRDFKGAVVGKFYRPVKHAVTIRLDADIVDWLKQDGRGYQTRINDLLRSVMERQIGKETREVRR